MIDVGQSYADAMQRGKELIAEYFELHAERIKKEEGNDSYVLQENGQLTHAYKLGLMEANLEYILATNKEEMIRFQTIVNYNKDKNNG